MSTERQQLFVLHFGSSKWKIIADIYILAVGSQFSQISNQCSCYSLPDTHNRIQFPSNKSPILSIIAYTTGHNYVYCFLRPHYTVINHRAMPNNIDTLLMFIFNIRQGACCFLFGLYRWPLLRICVTMTKSLLNFLNRKTKDHSLHIIVQIQYRAGSMTLSLWPRYAASTVVIHNNDHVTVK